MFRLKVTAARSNQGHTMTLHIYTPNQCPYQVSTSYTLHFLTYRRNKLFPQPSWRRRGRGEVKVRYIIYFVRPLPQFGGVVGVEVCPSNFSWRRHGRGVVEVRNCLYLLGPLPHFWGMVEVCPTTTDHSDHYHGLSMKINGTALNLYHAPKMWYKSDKMYTITHLYPTSTAPLPRPLN